MSDELKAIIDELKMQGKMLFCEGATEEKVADFEEQNNFKFPQQFKEWLMFSDGGECFLPAGVQFYGVSSKPVIDVDDDSRPSANYIVVGALASGDPILCEKESNRISIYNQEAGVVEDDEVYSDFYSFLKDLHCILGIEE